MYCYAMTEENNQEIENQGSISFVPTRVYENDNGGRIYPLKGKGDPYSDAVRAKTKGSGSDKRKLAMKIVNFSRIKKEDKLMRRYLELTKDPTLSMLNIIKLQEDLLNANLNDRNKISLMKAMVDTYRAFFIGNKISVSADIDFNEQLVKWVKARKEANKSESSEKEENKEDVKNE